MSSDSLILFFLFIATVCLLYIIYILDFKRRLQKVKLIGGEYAVNRRQKELLFDNSVYACVSVDLNQKILVWNESAKNKLGWSEEEMIGQNIKKIIPFRFHAKHDLGFQHFKDTGETKFINDSDGVELFALHKNGTEIPIHLKLKLLNDSGGFKTIGAYFRNILKEKQKEEALMFEIKLLQDGEVCAEIASWRLDLLDIYKNVNVSKNFYNIYNLDKDEPVTSALLIKYVYHEDRERVALVKYNSISDAKENYTVKYRRLQQDGTLQSIKEIGCLIKNERFEVAYLTGTIQKIINELG